MTDPEFFKWMAAYKIRFLGPGEQDEFVVTWKPEILKRELGDMLQAINDVALDDRVEARFPRQHLRLLLEYADEHARRRKPSFGDPLKGLPPPTTTSAWDKWMLQRGVINKAEFNKRERERKEGGK